MLLFPAVPGGPIVPVPPFIRQEYITIVYEYHLNCKRNVKIFVPGAGAGRFKGMADYVLE